MEQLQLVMDDLLLANPEFTFFETCAELLKSEEIEFDATQHSEIHVMLHEMFQRSKRRAMMGRINQDI